MRYRDLFGQTQRQAPRYPAEDGRHWLMRGGYLYEAAEGRVWLPLGQRLLQNLAAVPQTEGLPRALPLGWLPPPLPWPRTLPPLLQKLLAAHIHAYRQLPRLLAGWHGDRWYALAVDETAAAARARLRPFWERWRQALHEGGVVLTEAEAASATAALASTPSRASAQALACPRCGYHGLQPWARRQKSAPPAEPLQPLTPVATPQANTIRSLAEFLGVPESRTAKAVFLETVGASPRLVFAVVRGDMQVSLPKLAHCLGVQGLRPASEEAIRRVGAVPGYASPVGVKGAWVVVDDLIPKSPNLVAGANREGYHFTGVNYGRDFQADLVADIVAAAAGDPCPRCGAGLEARPAHPILHWQAWEGPPTYLDTAGKARPLGVAALVLDGYAALTALAEANHDEAGLAWPPALAPFAVHLIALRGGEAQAESLYAALQEAGLPVLLDARKASPGVKFADADLLGFPWRVTVSKRSLAQGGVELKPRRGEALILPPEAALARLRSVL